MEQALHNSSDAKLIKRLLLEDKVDINARNEIGEAPIHTLVRRAVQTKGTKKHEAAFECLWNYLIHCNNSKFDINIKSDPGQETALHMATEGNDMDVVRALLVFGADVNELDILNRSPIDYAKIKHNQDMVDFLQIRGAYEGFTLRRNKKRDQTDGVASCMPVKAKAVGDLKPLHFDTVFSVPEHKLGETPLELSIHNGQRILCLDGGGLKGLILIEVLIHIEKLTGKRIVDLFDWIVGTSTGGVIALALVYAKKSLQDLKQLFFQLKDDVFGTATMLGKYGCDTSKLEAILRHTFGETMKLTEVTEPRVMVTAVNCTTSSLKLVFFNNCLYQNDVVDHDKYDDKYRDVLVWKAARYTSAAPLYFEPKDGYTDGGIKANNPTDLALTEIQKYLDLQDEAHKIATESFSVKDAPKAKAQKTKYACVVSVGCGIFPAEELGDFSIQKYFSIGTQTLQLYRCPGEFKNLLAMLGNAISIEEDVAESCRLRCEKQGIAFYRFSPPFDETDPQVLTGETDLKKLCTLIYRAQSCLNSSWDVQIKRLAKLLERVEKAKIQAAGFPY